MELANYATLTQTRAAERCSDKYSFIPTSRALDVLAQRGWFPVKVREARVRDENRQGFQRHIVRLRRESAPTSLAVGQGFFEQVLINAHDGGAAFSLMGGWHEKVCSNGLIVCTNQLGAFRIRHQGYSNDLLDDAISNLTDAIPQVMGRIEHYQKIVLDPAEQEAFAKSAMELRFDGEKYAIDPRDVLRARRGAQHVNGDGSRNLWNTFNVVQENILRGGIIQRGIQPDARRRSRARAVTSVAVDTKINKSLWMLTEEMAKLKTSH